MASSNIARLGVVLGLDTAALTADVNKAIEQFRTLKSQIKRESEAAAKEILSLKYATEDYGKEISKVTQVERELTSGRLKNAAPDLQRILREQAKAYDDVVAASKKYAQEQSVAQQLSELKVATDTYGHSLTKVQQVERDVVKFNLVDQTKIDALRQQAAAYDRVAESAKRAQATESLIRDIQALKFATDDYGRSLTKLEQVNRDIADGKYQLADQAKIAGLRQQAQAYDQVAEAAKKAQAAESLSREIQTLKFATEDYGKTLTKVQQVERDISLGKYRSNDQQQIQQLLAQAKAYDQVAKSGRDVTKGLTEQQKLGLTYQTTDLITQIASGQNALIAMLQQGGQLKDQMGGIGPMFTAIRMSLTPMVLGMTAAAVVMGTLGLAFYQGAKESADLRDQLILTGNYANLSQQAFQDLADTVSTKTNLSIGKTKDILMELVKSGKFTDESMGSVAEAISIVAKLSGETATEVAQKLIPAFDGGAGSIKSLNDKMHFLTLEQYKHIVLLDKQGKSQEAAKIAADALTQKYKEQGREVSDLESIWSKFGNTLSSVWDTIKKIGASKDLEERIAILQRQLAVVVESPMLSPEESSNPKAASAERLALQAELDALLEKKRLKDEQTKKAQEQTRLIKDQQEFGQKRIDIAFQADQQMLKNKFDLEKQFANDFQRIDLETQQEAQRLINETKKKDIDEAGKLAKQNAEKLSADLYALDVEAQAKRTELIRKKYTAEYNAWRELQDEFDQAWGQENARVDAARKAASDRIEQERKSIEYDIEKASLQQALIGQSEKVVQLAMLELETKRQIKEIESNRDLTDSDKAKRIEEILRNQTMKNVFIDLQDNIKRTQQVYAAVFGNMERALENFVRTGKLSFKDLARSIIQDLIAIELKASAVALFQFFKNMIPGLNASGGTITGGSGLKFTPRAYGGPVNSGSPYMVGERGPEMFVPRSSGTIIPNNAMGFMQAPQVVNNYNISAIDVKSFEDRIMGSSTAVWAANAYANKSLAIGRGRA
jgi:phage-related minor tail protein